MRKSITFEQFYSYLFLILQYKYEKYIYEIINYKPATYIYKAQFYNKVRNLLLYCSKIGYIHDFNTRKQFTVIYAKEKH